MGIDILMPSQSLSLQVFQWPYNILVLLFFNIVLFFFLKCPE